MTFKMVLFFATIYYAAHAFCAQEKGDGAQKPDLRVRAASAADEMASPLATPLSRQVTRTMREIDEMLSPRSPKSPLEKEYLQKIKDAHEEGNMYKGDNSLVALHKQAKTRDDQLKTLLLLVNHIDEQAEGSGNVRYGSPKYVGRRRTIERKMSE